MKSSSGWPRSGWFSLLPVGDEDLVGALGLFDGCGLSVAALRDYGKLAWISDPVNGRRHDYHCLEESGVLQAMNPQNWIGDKGYIGSGMITPYRKPMNGELRDWHKEHNRQVGEIRWKVEQVIVHFKRMDHHAHRLPAPAENLRDNHLSSGWPALLLDDLNNLH
jgi:hypothetical protein